MGKKVWKGVNDDATRWTEFGQTIEGTYEGFTLHTFEGREVKQHTVENGGPRPVRFWGTTVLDDRLAGVEEGTRVRIVYRGEEGKPPRRYKSFDVAVEVEEETSA